MTNNNNEIADILNPIEYTAIEKEYITAREKLQQAFLYRIAPAERAYNQARQEAYMIMQIDLIPIEKAYKTATLETIIKT